MRKYIVLFLAVMLIAGLLAAPVQAKTYYGDQCTGGSECACWDFFDLDPSAWYHVGVDFVICNGYMFGYGNGVFGPNDLITRAQLVQILYNIEGRPGQTGTYDLVDVGKRDWYYDAFRWAFANEIVTPNTPGVFGPNTIATRQEAAKLLYDYARYRGQDVSSVGSLGSFRDSAAVSNEAHAAMAWAVGAGIISGTGDGMLSPFDPITRAQWATVLQRYCG